MLEQIAKMLKNSMQLVQEGGETKPKWSKKNILDFLHEFVFKKHWRQVERSVAHLRNTDSIWEGEDSYEVLKKVMKKCNGALDVYGPVKHLERNFDKFCENIPDERKYQDSDLMHYCAKKDILKSVMRDALKVNVLMVVDENIFDLLVESVNAQVDRKLAGTYEILVCTWFESVSYNLGMCHRESCYDVQSATEQCEKEATRWAKDYAFVFSEFSKLFSKEHDKKLLNELQKLLEVYFEGGKPKSSDCAHLLVSLRHLKIVKEWLLATINKEPYVLLPFSDAEKVLGSEIPVEPPVIRLISIGDDKILFAKDVENAVERVIRRKNVKDSIPSGLLKVESEEEKGNGLYFTITRLEYLEILKKLQLSEDCIILVDAQVPRNSHLTTPIFSPYATECKPAFDVFNELLGILIVEMRVWERIHPNKVKKVEEKIEEVCTLFMDPNKPRHFIELSRVEKLGDHLRSLVVPLLRKPLDALPPMRLFDGSSATFTIDLLQASAQRFLCRFYPEIVASFPIVFAQRTNFYTPTTVSRLELAGILQNCLAFCLKENIRLIDQFICSQKECRHFSHWKCSCVTSSRLSFENRSLYTPAAITDEYDYGMKFSYFAHQNHSFGSLIRKSDKQQLIAGYMAHAFVMNNVLNQIEPLYRKRIASFPLFQGHVWSGRDVSIYITSAEMMHLAKDVVKKFNLQYKSQRFEAIRERSVFFDETSRDNVLTQWIHAAYSQCLKFSASVLADASSFEKYMPNRTVHLLSFRCQMNDTDTMQLCVDSGDFLSVLKTKMLQSEVAETRESLHAFIHLVEDSQDDGEFSLLEVDQLVRCLEEFPVNPGEFCFVPELDCVFRSFTRQVSCVIAQEQDPKTVNLGEEIDGGDEMAEMKESARRMCRELAEKSSQLRVAQTDLRFYEIRHESVVKNHHEEVRRLNGKLETIQRESRHKLDVEGKNAKSLSEKIDATEATVATLQKQLVTEKKNSMQQMKKKGEELKEVAKNLKSTEAKLAEREKTIEEQNKALIAKEKEIARLTKGNTELREKLQVERQAAEKTVGELSKKLKEASESRKEEELLANRVQVDVEIRLLKTQLRMEQFDHESARQRNEAQRNQIAYLESLLAGRHMPAVPNRSIDSPPTTPSPEQPTSSQTFIPTALPTAEQEKRPDNTQLTSHKPAVSKSCVNSSSVPECLICLGAVGAKAKAAQCKECRTRFHPSCIEEWVQKKATCPVCSRSFPSPSNFPPLK